MKEQIKAFRNRIEHAWQDTRDSSGDMWAIAWRLTLFAFFGLVMLWLGLVFLNVVVSVLLIMFPYAVLALLGYAIWYFAFRDKGSEKADDSNASSGGRIIDQ